MMRTLWLMVLFALATVVDGVVAPGLFHINESFLALVLPVTLVTAYGIRPWAVLCGLAMTGAAEILLGLHPGSAALPFLVAVLAWHLLTRTVSIGPFIQEGGSGIAHVFAGVALMGVFWAAMFTVSTVFYGMEPALPWAIPFFLAYAVIGQALFLYLVTRCHNRSINA